MSETLPKKINCGPVEQPNGTIYFHPGFSDAAELAKQYNKLPEGDPQRKKLFEKIQNEIEYQLLFE